MKNAEQKEDRGEKRRMHGYSNSAQQANYAIVKQQRSWPGRWAQCHLDLIVAKIYCRWAQREKKMKIQFLTCVILLIFQYLSASQDSLLVGKTFIPTIIDWGYEPFDSELIRPHLCAAFGNILHFYDDSTFIMLSGTLLGCETCKNIT